MKEKLLRIIEAIVIIALGVIIAVCGGGEALDLYFGIISLVGGVALLIIAILGLAKEKVLLFGPTFLSVALITVGIALFTNWLSFAVLITLVVFLILALGVALVLYGIYTMLAKKNTFYGLVQVIMGIIIAVLAILFLAIEDFRTAFWIIVGIVVVVYGVLALVSVFLPSKKAEQ